MDYINSEMGKIKNNEEADVSGGEALIQKVENCLNEISGGKGARPDTKSAPKSTGKNTVSEESKEVGLKSYQVTLFLDEGCAMENIGLFQSSGK
jgi:hypothetical protein